jgi:hypothetical protein
MAFCPECGAEFRSGFRRCPECLVDLVDELVDSNLYDPLNQDLVTVREGLDPHEAGKIKSLLEKNRIPCLVEDASPGQQLVLVSPKDRERSLQLITARLK